jgi:hypothetical protein
MLKRLFGILILVTITSVATMAQCAMCRATLESNVSNGAETALSGSLNVGILYLFVAPYLIVATVAYFWYKNSQTPKNTKGIAH